ncbi:ATP-dependent zinc metalloprotease FtsH [Corynebacterium xerosis]|uniref:ATP-dependent zinc metalloprotease FtsH n=1 Tax=Corynebacterium xerosis TaxID=1725 RepID=UPI000EB5B0D6|nr:ATP-dependent zinc metalloprotease FtsH [Corynebacterium xerosis]AYJ33621.1 ATP-dependent zinc metalloprotease FtsH [Corynebacterium xerosis]
MDKNKVFRIAGIVGIFLLILFAVTTLTDDTRSFREVDTSVAIAQLDAGNVAEAQIDDREQRLRLTLKDGIEVEETEDVKEVMAQYPARAADRIFEKVSGAEGVDKYTTEVTQDSFLMSTLGFLLPMLIFFVLIMWVFSRMQGGRGGMFGFGNSKAKLLNKEEPTNTFEDVAGADEAVQELDEIRDFLQNPARYEALGAKIPRGVLLYGPPGTGKTLLARAVAGEAGVPFYTISGSDFVEMFVGVGASRVRDLFNQAKENSPCIIFIDEIDAVGRQRGAGMGGGHDEREQTLNQLLVEMDGFSDRSSVIIMAATNRPDILDPALLRPGRFDRQIPVGAPDMAGRKAILEVHARNKPLGPDADLESLAKRTAGMSGADLQNVLNEAALLTARVNGDVITADALEEAVDRVVGGPRRTSKVISEQEKKVTAYHEGGHTLAAWALKDIERVYKVTILARGRTGGHAMTVPEDDKGMYNLPELFARLVFAMGGRAAEELVFGLPTTGASADIEQATKIARAMVTEYGMTASLGPVKYGEEAGDPFVGRGGSGQLDYSPAVAAKIDEEVRGLISKAHDEAYDILRENRDTLDVLAEKLLEKETLRRPDLEAMFTDVRIRERLDFLDTDKRHPRDGREPVKTPVELAIERGEEPPRRENIFAPVRPRRQDGPTGDAEQGRQGPGQPGQRGLPGQPGQPGGPGAGPVSGGSGDRRNVPVYGGTPPPPDWTVPGWPPKNRGQNGPGGPNAPHRPGQGQGQGHLPGTPGHLPDQPGQPGQSGQQGQSNQPSQPNRPGGHPGAANYPAPSGWQRPAPDQKSDQKPEQNPQQAPEQSQEPRGFRLPDREQPENKETPKERKGAPEGRPLGVTDSEPTREMPKFGGRHRAPGSEEPTPPRPEDNPGSVQNGMEDPR